jgi:hypothetical protein
MTAHKAQGKTLTHAVINLQNCSGTEAPYVMISRVTSLDELLILKGFPKSKIMCRQSQECRDEARRHEYLALQTIISTGTSTEAAEAEAIVKKMFISSPVDYVQMTRHSSWSRERPRMPTATISRLSPESGY